MTLSILVSIEPPKSVKEGIYSIRKELGDLNQQNRYGKSHPHITLFINTYNDQDKIDKTVESISRKHQPFTAKVHGLHYFGYDVKTDLYTLVYLIEENPKLKELQMDIVKNINYLRNYSQANKCLQNHYLTNKQLENIRIFGFPYSPVTWNFHATIGSFPEKMIDTVKNISKKYDSKEEWLVDKVQLMRKKIGESPHQLYKEIKL
jgi:2'-5' RNA ligase